MFTHDYPYTDFHELNLDWLMKTVKELKTAYDAGIGSQNAMELFNLVQIVGEERQYTVNGSHFYKRDINGVNQDTFREELKLILNSDLTDLTSTFTFIIDDIPGLDLLWFYLNATFNAETPTQSRYIITETMRQADFTRFRKAGTFFNAGIIRTTQIDDPTIHHYDQCNLACRYSGGNFYFEITPKVPHIDTCYIDSIQVGHCVSY